MAKYVIKRILMLIPILLGVTIIIFALKVLTPGDPVEQILGNEATEEQYQAKRVELGLDKPVPVQFFNYVKDIVTKGDFGTSYRTGEPVVKELMPRLRTSLIICLGAVAIGAVIGVCLGVISALKKYTWIDSLVLTISMFFTSIPQFCVALVLIYFFSVMLGVLPSNGIETAAGYILPMVCIGLHSLSNYTRITRSSMLEVISQDYIRTARSKGQTEGAITWHHSLRNAMIPVAAAIGNQLGHQLGGALIIETVFGVPGVGKYIADAIIARNYPSVLGGVLLVAFLLTIVNLLVDISFLVIDPRLKKSLISSKGRGGRRIAAQRG